MNQDEAKLICEILSQERFAPYLSACGGDPSTALRLYAWNTEISGALLGPFQGFEVVLRNALDRELRSHFGRVDWWNSASIRLTPHAVDKIQEAARPSRRRPAPTPGDVVSSLSLGFWESLLAASNNYETHLWRPALRRAFPGYSGLRGPLHDDVYNLRALRNRIAHCEPIHARHLAADYQTLLRVLGYVSPEAARCIDRFSRMKEVLDRKSGVLDGTLPPRI
ncbi:hypothetical protein [Sphaerimonospora thailandensis]|uniref:Abi-like protein n=1 Tax=Sphaerimonospora thailandensis TaxID=795644 RepID=A0A8J3R525_9ACTN|nr:hypothetical protein [Sphaerimonospora thailandensis]GIH69232.1 hypothetical protein Mth01_14850 [Sphaerimonospora thailandensis]